MLIYLDHAATAPICEAAKKAIVEHLDDFGNPSSSHELGRQSRMLIEDARERIAKCINAEPEEIISLYHNLLYRLNTPAKFRIPVLCESGTRVCEATIIGVEANGCLMLKHTEGEVCRYAFKEVEFII